MHLKTMLMRALSVNRNNKVAGFKSKSMGWKMIRGAAAE